MGQSKACGTSPVSRRSSPSPPLPMDDDDLLREILLRLPPLPSTLPRVSLVCKRWRRLVSDPAFLRRFRTHHGRPPVIGFFSTFGCPAFTPALDPPDRIPAARFSLRLEEGNHYQLLGCRHDRALLLNRTPRPFLLVWNPVTGDQPRVAVPPEFSDSDKIVILTGALICTAGDRGHAHGDCHSGSFQAALLATDRGRHTQFFASIYTSETGKWSEITSTSFIQCVGISPAMRSFQPIITPTILVGNSVYWSYVIAGACIVEFDLDRQKIALIEPPPDVNTYNDTVFAVTRADDGGLGLLIVSDFRAQLWKRKAGDCDDGAIWVLGRTVQLDKLLSLGAAGKRKSLALVGFDEETM